MRVRVRALAVILISQVPPHALSQVAGKVPQQQEQHTLHVSFHGQALQGSIRWKLTVHS